MKCDFCNHEIFGDPWVDENGNFCTEGHADQFWALGTPVNAE